MNLKIIYDLHEYADLIVHMFIKRSMPKIDTLGLEPMFFLLLTSISYFFSFFLAERISLIIKSKPFFWSHNLSGQLNLLKKKQIKYFNCDFFKVYFLLLNQCKSEHNSLMLLLDYYFLHIYFYVNKFTFMFPKVKVCTKFGLLFFYSPKLLN